MTGKHAITRFCRHIFSGPWLVGRYFPRAVLCNIEAAISHSEAGHSGEIRFVVEAALHPYDLLHGKTARQRAIELFARLGIWDTQDNSGVLIYLLLADHDIEIVADRGINDRVSPGRWEAICHAMESDFRQGQFESGVLSGITEISQILQREFPAGAQNENELPDAPIVL
ncbi:MAG TPA: TPM domain-containing protein [Methylophilaceae bacterium]|nr:TPM domain-containing protein [Methylophilaceae bacterium]